MTIIAIVEEAFFESQGVQRTLANDELDPTAGAKGVTSVANTDSNASIDGHQQQQQHTMDNTANEGRHSNSNNGLRFDDESRDRNASGSFSTGNTAARQPGDSFSSAASSGYTALPKVSATSGKSSSTNTNVGLGGGSSVGSGAVGSNNTVSGSSAIAQDKRPSSSSFHNAGRKALPDSVRNALRGMCSIDYGFMCVPKVQVCTIKTISCSVVFILCF